MRIGYLKNLGRHELEQASSKWQTLHENEKIDLEDFYNSMSLYAHAIYALGNLK